MCARKIVNAPKVEVHYGEKKRTLFGWCIDGHDKDCAKEFPGHECSCACHGSEDETLDEVPATISDEI